MHPREERTQGAVTHVSARSVSQVAAGPVGDRWDYLDGTHILEPRTGDL